MRLQFLFFLPAVLASWNCELPIGSGDYGRCVDGVTGNWDACSAVCVPSTSLLFSTADIHSPIPAFAPVDSPPLDDENENESSVPVSAGADTVFVDLVDPDDKDKSFS
ncbi:hypothetical protein FBULB1_3740 [Fusarium bulbicola]|nr:hypothetical protein FBULB1_3740 [Fusarium bulbicola]